MYNYKVCLSHAVCALMYIYMYMSGTVHTYIHFVLCRKWLESQSGLVESVVFTYLSLIPYHTSSQLAGLRHQEAKFCVSLIRDNVRIPGNKYTGLVVQFAMHYIIIYMYIHDCYSN